MNRGRDIDDAITWLELASRVARLPATGLLARLREGDDDLADAILAILAMGYKPSRCLDAMRDFLVQQSLGETWDPTTDVLPSTRAPETSPFEVPQRFLDVWFPQTTPSVRDHPIEALMRIRQYYDCIDLDENTMQSKRMFGNEHIGDAMRCNLQAPGQLTFDNTAVLLTSWWITTADWPGADEFFAQNWLTLVVGNRPEAMTLGLELKRRRQSLLVPVPPRTNFSVTFDVRRLFAVPPNRPVYVFVEGWGQRGI
jgi:hypothetical protein